MPPDDNIQKNQTQTTSVLGDSLPGSAVENTPKQGLQQPDIVVAQMPEQAAPPAVEIDPSVSENIQPPSLPPLETTIESLPTPKRGIPKIVIYIALGLILISFVVAIIKIISSRTQKTKVTTITWWGLWEEEAYFKPLIDEYQTKNPKVKISFVRNSPQDYRERLNSAIAKGTAPDIFRFHNSWASMLNKDLDNVPASVMGASEYSQIFYPVVVTDLTSGSGLVGIPLGFDALTLFVNTDMFKEESLEPPTTWVELRERAQQLTKKENDKIIQAGVALGRTENVDHWPEIVGLMLLQNGADVNKSEGKLVEDALVFYTLFSQVDGVWDATLPASTQTFASGKLAMYFGPSWRALNIKELNPDLNFKTVPLPQLPKESSSEPNMSYATYWAEGVWSKSKNRDIAWDFLKFLIQEESLEKFYQQAANARGFGEAYPRVDMGTKLTDHEILGSIVKLAPEARSWYLVDRTYDGSTGINSQIRKYYEDAINALNAGKQPQKAMESLPQGVKQVLTQYGLMK